MIAKLTGKIEYLKNNYAVVDVSGIGYKVFLSAYTFGKVAGMPEVSLFIHTYVREDTLALYGFLTSEELEMFELLRRAHNLISKFSDELEKGKVEKEKIQKLLEDLEQSRIEIDLVASLLIASKKEGEAQNLEDIKGLKISEIGTKELAEDKNLENKLGEMYEANNSHKSKEDLARLMRDFEEHKKHNPRFYLIYFDQGASSAEASPEKSLDNLVGFIRSSSFDGQKELGEGERYLGAMNIDPLLQKFYFGENFLRETLEKELGSGTRKIVAHFPKGGVSHKMVESLSSSLELDREEKQEGEYRNDNGEIIAKRLRVELMKKQD